MQRILLILILLVMEEKAISIFRHLIVQMDGIKLLQFIIIPTEMIGNTLSFQIIKIGIFSLTNRLLC